MSGNFLQLAIMKLLLIKRYGNKLKTRCFWASWFRILLSSSKNSKKNLHFSCFLNSSWLFIFEKWWKCSFKKSNKQKNLVKKLIFSCDLEGHWRKWQRYGSADPDPYRNVTDPQHCLQIFQHFSIGSKYL